MEEEIYIPQEVEEVEIKVAANKFKKEKIKKLEFNI